MSTGTVVAIAHTSLQASADAGKALGEQIIHQLGRHPQVVLTFVAPDYNPQVLLHTLKETCDPQILLGCSSAGELSLRQVGTGQACALALSSEHLRFRMGVGRGLRKQRHCAAQELLSSFEGPGKSEYPYRCALLLVDALAGYMEDLVEHLTLLTAGTYQFVGGGAGDNGQFAYTPVFSDTQVLSDAVVGLEILSQKPIGIGMAHGWQPATPPLLVTASHGCDVACLNDRPALEFFERYAATCQQPFRRDDPLPFFLHTLLGIQCGNGYTLRVPLSIQPGGAIRCASEIAEGRLVSLMKSSQTSVTEAARVATQVALEHIHESPPAVALFFDCVATRLRMGQAFAGEVDVMQQTLGTVPFFGCNSHGQIVRANGQFQGFHHCTAVTCLLPI